MNPQMLLTLGVIAAAYFYRDKLGAIFASHPNTPQGSSTASDAHIPDYGSVVQQATGLPASNGVTAGVLPNGDVRTMPPATPTAAAAAATANNVSYTPQVIDGNWINAPQGVTENLYNQQNLAAGSGYAKPEILPAFNPDMLSAIRKGYTIDLILGAAAAMDIFNYDGWTATNGSYSLPVSAWSYYKLQYRPGTPYPMTNVSDVVTVEQYWDRVAHSGNPGVIGLGRDSNWGHKLALMN